MSEAIAATEAPQPQRRIFLFGESEQQAGAADAPQVTRERWDRVRAALTGAPYEPTPELVADLLIEFGAQERFRRVFMTACMQAVESFQQLASQSTAEHEAALTVAGIYAAGYAAGTYMSYSQAASRLADVMNMASAEAGK